MVPYINWKFASYPSQLPCIGLEFLYTARVRLANIDGILSQAVDDLEVLLEHVRMLIILAVDVLLDSGR